MPGPHLAGVLLVVVEILGGQGPLLVTEQPVRLHYRRVELDLDLHVLGDGHKRPAELLDERLVGFPQGVDVGVVAVPLAGELDHHLVPQVAHPEPEHAQEDARLSLLLDHLDQLVGAGGPDVPVAVRAEDDAVGPVLDEVVGRHLVSLLDPARPVGRPARLQRVEGVHDLFLLARRGRVQDDAGVPGIHDHGDPVLLAELADEELERRLDQR